MAQQRAVRNGSVVTECVFENPQVAALIDKCHVEPEIRQRPCRFGTYVFFRTMIDALHLLSGQLFNRAFKVFAFLDLDKHQAVSAPEDQIDFTDGTAPPLIRQRVSAVLVILRDP